MRSVPGKDWRLLFDDFVDLNDAGNGGVVSLVGDKVGGGVGESVLHVGEGVEEEVADGMVGRRCAGRKAAESAVDLEADKASRGEEASRHLKVGVEIVVPVELRASDCGIHDAQSDHPLEHSTGFARVID